MRNVAVLLSLALAGGLACGGAQPAEIPIAPGASAEPGAPERDEVPITPEKTPPPGLSEREQNEMSGTCMPLLTRMIEADARAITVLDAALRDSPNEADAKALAFAVDQVSKSSEGLTKAEHDRCLELFEKQERRKLFEHDPGEGEARAAVGTCVERVKAGYGKATMSFDEGSHEQAQSPFCPDDFPVPPKLGQLPYQSSSEDWATPTWRCLQFGMRGPQRIQFEYSAPIRSGEFTCIARYLPRAGGAPVEIFQGGKQGSEGQLLIAPKMLKRRMQTK
jgi:hypothetical protein